MNHYRKKFKSISKRAVSLLIATTLVISTESISFAADNINNGKAELSEQAKELIEKGSKNYPDGAFGLVNTQISIREGEKDQTITVVRMGSTKGKATVEFHALDVSSKYGKDYELYVGDSALGCGKLLKASKNNKSLMNKYGDQLVATNPQAQAAQSDEGEADDVVSKIAEDSEVNYDDLNELEKAQYAQTGTLQKNKGWREVNDENSDEYKEMEQVVDNGNENIDEMINQLGGVTEKLVFKDGEKYKEVRLHVPDDNKSDGEVQAMFALTNAKNAEISDARNGYINIADDEKSEKAEYSFSADKITVEGGAESIDITVKKEKGTEQLSVVTLLTTDGTATSGNEYEAAAETLIFPKGVKEKTVKINIKGNYAKEDKNFYVGIGSEKGKIDENNGLLEVVLRPTKQDTVDSSETKKTSSSVRKKDIYHTDESVTGSTLRIDFATWDCHAREFDYHTSGSDESDYGYDFRNAEKVDYFRLNDWGNGNQDWAIYIKLTNGSFIKLGDHDHYNWSTRSLTVRDPKGNNANISGCFTHTFTDDEKKLLAKYGNGAKFYAWVYDHPGWGAEDWGNCNLTYAEIYYNNLKIETEFSDTKNNYYLPKTFTSVKEYKEARDGVFLIKPEIVGNTNLGRLGWASSYINLQYGFHSNKNDAGVSPNSENVNFEGFYVRTGNEYVKLGTYTGKYLSEFAEAMSQTASKTLTVIPKATPKKTTVKFVKGDDGVKFTNYEFGSTISNVACLDIVRVKAYPTQTDAVVDGFKAVCNGKEIPVIMDEGSRDSGSLLLNGDCAGKTVEIMPVRGKLSLTVMAHPMGRNVDKGFVIYSPESNENGEVKEPLKGDYKTPLEVPDPIVDKSYTIIGQGISEEEKDTDYIVEWMDASADTDGDGKFTIAELDNYYGKGDHSTHPYTFRSTAYEYVIQTSGPKKIYYQFTKADKEPSNPNLRIFGITAVKEGNIFPIGNGKTKVTPTNGITVSGVEDSYVSVPDPDDVSRFGYFELKNPMLDAFQRFLIIGNYQRGDGSVMVQNSVVQPNAELMMIFDINNVMKVTGGKLEKWIDPLSDGDSGEFNFSKAGYKEVDSFTALKNDDRKYKLTVSVESSKTSRQPAKVSLVFYDSNGTELENSRITKELKVTDYGKVSFEFNPKSFSAPKNTYLCIQVEDQFGTSYPQQKTGYKMYESLGEKNLKNTFAFGSAFTAVKIIGMVQGQEGTKWNGSLDEGLSSNVVGKVVEIDHGERESGEDGQVPEKPDWTEYQQLVAEKTVLKNQTGGNEAERKAAIERLEEQLENNEVKTLTLTLGISKDDVYEDKKQTGDTVEIKMKEKAKADQELAKAMKDMADADTDAKKAKAREAYEKADKEAETAKQLYEKAIENKVTPKKTTTEFAKNVKMGLGFTFVVSFKYDEVVENWYFSHMMMTISADGKLEMKWKFATPIGVVIGLGIKVEGHAEATVIFRDKIDDKKFYLASEEGTSSLQEDEEGGINIFALAADGEYVDTVGAFVIQPSITLSADASFAIIEAEVSGTVGLDMSVTTDNTPNSGTVSLSASISVKVLIIPAKWTFKTSPIKLFGGSSKSLDEQLGLDGDASLMFGSAKRFIEEDHSYAESRKKWQGEHPVSAKAIDESPDGVVVQKLQEKVYSGSIVDIEKINDNGDYLGVFTDVDTIRANDINKPAAYYSIYNGATGQWSAPVIIEDDGTVDSDVRLYTVGDRGFFIVWDTASEVLPDDISRTQMLNKFDIHGAFFDKEKKEFKKKDGNIDIIQVTKDTEELYADVDPSIIESGNTMVVYYTKSKYAISDTADGELVGDVVWPESTYRVFRTYNFADENGTDGAFVEDYEELLDKTVAEEIKAAVDDYDEYVEEFYGQVFLDTVPDVYIDEHMDDEGRYWASEPDIYVGHKVTSTTTGNSDDDTTIVGEDTVVEGTTVVSKSAPYVIDYDAISYNKKGIFAYTVDYDNDLKTVNDRDVYFQMYDFETGVMTHPVIVTSDNDLDSNVRLSRESYTNSNGEKKEATLLSWISDGSIVSLDISNVIKNLGEPRITGKGIRYYLIEKTEEAGYIPPTVIASGNTAEIKGLQEEGAEELTAEELANKAHTIDDFDIYSAEGYNYYVWTDRTTTTKEGISDDSALAGEADNRVVESQIYMVRNDLAKEEITSPVQVTSEEGANYESISFVVNEDGTLKALARKSESHVVDYEEFNNLIEENNKVLPEEEKEEKVTEEEFTPYNDVTDTKDLVALDIVPRSTPKFQKTDELLKGIDAGDNVDIQIPILNDGIDTLDEITVSATDEDGNGVIYEIGERIEPSEEIVPNNTDERKLVKSTKLKNVVGGSTEYVTVHVSSKDTDKETSVEVAIATKDGEVIDKRTISRSFEEALAFEEVEVEKTEVRDVFDLSFVARNSGEILIKDKKLEVGVVDKDGKDHKLTEASVERLSSGNSTFITVDGIEVDSAKYFVETTDDNGNLTETGTFYVTDGKERSVAQVVRTATKKQVEAVNAVKKLTFNGGDSISIAKDEKAFVNILLDGKPVEETAGVRLILESSDQNIFTTNRTGTVEAYKGGNAKFRALVLPANSERIATFDGTEGENGVSAVLQDNYADVPTSLIRTFEANVKVTGTEEKQEDKPNTPQQEDKPNTPQQPDTPKAQSVVKDGVTYSVSDDGTASITKYSGNATAVTIPDTIAADGKTYKVTRIKARAFMNAANLTTVKIGKNITVIEKRAFYGCKKLKKVTLGKNITTIGSYAFAKCSKLKKITFQSKVKKIGTKAFYLDKKLKTVIFKPKKVPTIGKKAFYKINAKAIFKVPKKYKKKYKKKLGKKVGVTTKMKVK